MEDALRFYLLPLSAFLLLGSCSWYRSLERSLDDDPPSNRKNATVPKSQYDQLLVKYEELQKKYEHLKEKPNGSQNNLVDELQSSKSENNFSQESSSETETINIFAQEPGPSTEAQEVEVPSDLKSQIVLFRRAASLKTSNPSEAIKIFKKLDEFGAYAIKVRAKYQQANILLEKGQYDLSLQIFEEIITKYASSGVVLDALKGAVTASEKLGIMNKKDQYFSMLEDVFGRDQGT